MRHCLLVISSIGLACSTAAAPELPPQRLAPGPPAASSTGATVAQAAPPGSGMAKPPAQSAAPLAAPPPALAPAWVFDLPAPRSLGRTPLALWATYYYIPQVEHLESGHAMRDMEGRALGPRLGLRDWCEAAMQGTVMVAMPDGGNRTLNFAGVRKEQPVDCKPVYPRYPAINRSRFAPARGPHGDGVRGMILVPYRSVAVDPRVVPFGSVLFIPEARGTRLSLPTGQQVVHDGYFYAADRGGAIKGTHIDVFIGATEDNPFAFVRNRKKPSFAAYRVDLPEAQERLGLAHRPPAP